jgi:hypothetical protein
MFSQVSLASAIFDMVPSAPSCAGSEQESLCDKESEVLFHGIPGVNMIEPEVDFVDL